MTDYVIPKFTNAYLGQTKTRHFLDRFHIYNSFSITISTLIFHSTVALQKKDLPLGTLKIQSRAGRRQLVKRLYKVRDNDSVILCTTKKLISF